LEAAAGARGPWLMFGRPGVVVDSDWMDDVARLMENGGDRAGAFRPGYAAGRPVLLEAVSLWRLAVGGRPRADQGLLIPRALYDGMGGHRDGIDAGSDLLRPLGRRPIASLRSGATSPGE